MNLNLREYRKHSWGSHFPILVVEAIVIYIVILNITSNSFEFITGLVLLGFVLLTTALTAWSILKPILIARKLHERSNRFLFIASKIGMLPAAPNLNSTILDLKGKYDKGYSENSYKHDDYSAFDYNIEQHDGNDRNSDTYKRTLSFFVFVIDLPRELPNVFFDSKSTGGKEFKNIFQKNQIHSLEGDFDKYFTTYFAEDYTIDNLSFITPEVMQELITSHQYDVEIYKDKLFLYNEIENMPTQLLDARDKAEKIRLKLLNNILTYRDERLNYADGRNTVHYSGIRLKRVIFWYYIKFVLFVLLSLYAIPAYLSEKDLLVSVGLFWFGVALAYENYKKIKYEKSFHAN